MRYLITGGCGFVGSNLASRLAHRGADVHVLDNLSRVGAEANAAWLRSTAGIAVRIGDVRRHAEVNKAVADVAPEVVFHLAGQVAMTTSLADPRLDFEVNALGTFNVLEALRVFRPEATFVFASTNKVYGDLEWLSYREEATRYVAVDHPLGFREELPFQPESPYGVSKAAGDLCTQDFARMFGMRTVVFRHSSIYGGRQFSTYDQGWVGWFCQQAISAIEEDGPIFSVSGSGKQVRDLLHVDDVASLYDAAVTHGDEIRGEVFNAGGGFERSLSIRELLTRLETLLGGTLRYETLPPRRSDQRVFITDTSKAQRLLGWKPTVTVDEGVDAMLEWVRSQRTPVTRRRSGER